MLLFFFSKLQFYILFRCPVFGEYHKYRETYFLDKKEGSLPELINKYAQKTDTEIEKIEKQKAEIESLKKILNAYSNRDVFNYYSKRNFILDKQENELYKEIVNNIDLENKINDFDKKDIILENYKKAKSDNEDIIKQELEFNTIKEQKTNLETYLNDNKQEDTQIKINELNPILNELNSKTIYLQADKRFNKISIDLTNRINKANDKEEEISKISKEKVGKVEGFQKKVTELENELEIAKSEYEKANTECKLFEDDVNINFLKENYNQNPELVQKVNLDKNYNDYNNHCNFLVKTYLSDMPNNKDITNYQFLVKEILPSIFIKDKFEESSVIQTIKDYLTKINEQVKEINSLFVQMLTKLFQEVIDTYQEYKLKYDEIKLFFSQNEAKITGGHSVKLSFETVDDYPTEFLDKIKVELNNQMSYTKGSLFLPKRNDIENMIIEKYHEFGYKRNIEVLDLLNPMNYFKMEFGIKSANGNENKGSTGQKYAAIALLCIAQMSKIYKTKQNKRPKGIRYMPIDDAQDLGSNYDMLYLIASNEDFQIITFSIEPLDNLKVSNQNWYMLQENPEEELINNPPFAMLSGVTDTIYEWETYLKTIYNE